VEDSALYKQYEIVLASWNSMPHGIYIVSEDGDIQFINSVIKEQFGEINGQKCFQYFHGLTESCPWCKNKEVFSGESVRWEWYSEKNDTYYDLYDMPIINPDGTTSKFEIFIDITKLKKAEKKVIEEKERLKVTLHSIGDGVITTDLDGNILLINKIAEHLTGWSQQDAIGRPSYEIFNIINEKTGKFCVSPVGKVLATGHIIDLENNTVLVAKDGSRYNIEDSGAPIFDQDCQIIGVVIVFRDVTEEKKTAEELFKIKKLESTGVLAGGIAHDFNNILAAILGNIELVMLDTESSNSNFPLLEDAKKATLRATDLTGQLLTFSKGGDPVKTSTSIASIIKDSADFVLHGSSSICKYTIPENLWSVDADAGQISQVIQNIVINARQAMPGGGVIDVSCENIVNSAEDKIVLSIERYVRITITDTGTGIPEKYAAKIFDPYFSTKQDGSGLGLAICHSIIHKHDGCIRVKTKTNEGTTFIICLPVHHISSEKISDEEKVISGATKKSTILVMDDEPMLLRLAQKMLGLLGHTVLLAENGREAINIYREYFENKTPIDIVFMDLTIPGGMGGKDAVGEILKIDPQAKVVVSSGYSNDPVMGNYEEHGFKAAISKPYAIEELGSIIEIILQLD
jgi:PAS domain S-box-containing protein